MSVATELTRIQTARNAIRTKMVTMGLAVGTDTIDELATKLEAVVDRGAVDFEVKEGESVTIPAGYHNGSGTCIGIAGGGNYSLQAKTVTPTKVQQPITPDEGKYGLSSVTVEAIPDNYQDVSSTTATSADVLANKVFVAADGTVTTGVMTNNGALALTFDAMTQTSVSIPAGYTSGGAITLTQDLESALSAI